MERLEGGLEKLKSTAAQVDDLKEKLAAQEVKTMIVTVIESQLIKSKISMGEHSHLGGCF